MGFITYLIVNPLLHLLVLLKHRLGWVELEAQVVAQVLTTRDSNLFGRVLLCGV